MLHLGGDSLEALGPVAEDPPVNLYFRKLFAICSVMSQKITDNEKKMYLALRDIVFCRYEVPIDSFKHEI